MKPMSKLKKTNRKKKSRYANRVTTEIAIPIAKAAVKAGVKLDAMVGVNLGVMVAAKVGVTPPVKTATATKTADASVGGVDAVAAAKAAIPMAHRTLRRAMNPSLLQKHLLRNHWKPVKASMKATAIKRRAYRVKNVPAGMIKRGADAVVVVAADVAGVVAANPAVSRALRRMAEPKVPPAKKVAITRTHRALKMNHRPTWRL